MKLTIIALMTAALAATSCAGKASQYNTNRQDNKPSVTEKQRDVNRLRFRPPGSCPDCDDGGPKPPPSYTK